MTEASIVTPPHADDPSPQAARTSWAARALAMLSLGGLVGGVGYAGRLTGEVLTDAWVAPLRLSPDNDRVLELRVQRTKERADRARLVAEMAGIDEQIRGADVGLDRLRRLAEDYAGALRWTTWAQRTEVRDLSEQVSALQSEHDLLLRLSDDQKRAVERTADNAIAGLVPQSDAAREQITLRQIDVSRQACELELARANAALNAAQAKSSALGVASGGDGDRHSDATSSPDVVKFYDDDARIEIEIARLEGERRAAVARKQAAVGTLEEMDDMLHELESKPLYRAMSKDTDMAFAPYEQLRRVARNDRVYACSRLVFDCRIAGTVAEIVPGEVITQDPWGQLARGQYLVLSMTDRSALFERVLRVRHGPPDSPAPSAPHEAAPTAAR